MFLIAEVAAKTPQKSELVRKKRENNQEMGRASSCNTVLGRQPMLYSYIPGQAGALC